MRTRYMTCLKHPKRLEIASTDQVAPGEPGCSTNQAGPGSEARNAGRRWPGCSTNQDAARTRPDQVAKPDQATGLVYLGRMGPTLFIPLLCPTLQKGYLTPNITHCVKTALHVCEACAIHVRNMCGGSCGPAPVRGREHTHFVHSF
jgi:hypothetical protein